MSSDKVYTGTVIWFNVKTGVGFIKQDHNTAQDMFVHYSDIKSDGFKAIYKDQKVSYQIGKNLRDQDKAILVEVLK